MTSGAARKRREAGWLEVLRELLAEESSETTADIGGAETLQHQIAQAAAHRVADEQRAGEHRHRGRHADDHGEVRPPVIAQAAGDELSRRIAATRP